MTNSGHNALNFASYLSVDDDVNSFFRINRFKGLVIRQPSAGKDREDLNRETVSDGSMICVIKRFRVTARKMRPVASCSLRPFLNTAIIKGRFFFWDTGGTLRDKK